MHFTTKQESESYSATMLHFSSISVYSEETAERNLKPRPESDTYRLLVHKNLTSIVAVRLQWPVMPFVIQLSKFNKICKKQRPTYKNARLITRMYKMSILLLPSLILNFLSFFYFIIIILSFFFLPSQKLTL